MFPYLGLKASTAPVQIKDRLQYHPDVFEFYTTAQDMTPTGLSHLQQMIDTLQTHGVTKIVIHQPMKFHIHHNELFTGALQDPAAYSFLMTSAEQLITIAQQMDVQVLIHGAYNEPLSYIHQFYETLAQAQAVVFKRLDYFQALGGQHVMFENSISPVFAFGDLETERKVRAHHYRLCFDTSHAFIYTHGDQKRLKASLEILKSQIVHYHLVDSMGQTHDSLPLGQGLIQWSDLKQVFNPKATNIFEINLPVPNDCQPMLDSYHYLKACYQH